jgi:GTP cyclohydrolase I
MDTDKTGPKIERLYNGAVIRSLDYVPVLEPEEAIEDVVVREMFELLQHITGTSFTVDHMQRTPERFVRMLRELTTPDAFEFTTFDNTEGLDEMIALTKIPFYTLCAHHIVPFYGYAYVAYIPQNRIAGLSKIPRTVKALAKGLKVQENLTVEIADFLEAKLEPLGVAVVLKAEHLCMAMRGVQAAGVLTTTSAMRGVFADHSRTAKAEFMAGINDSR